MSPTGPQPSRDGIRDRRVVATAVLDESLCVVFISQGLHSLLPRMSEAVAGLPAADVLGASWPELEPVCLKVLGSRRPAGPIAIRLRETPGAARDILVWLRPLLRPDESVAGVELTATNASSLPALVAKRPRDALTHLVGVIAHDFNNMLTAIGGYTGLVRDELPAGDPHRDDLDEALKAIARARVLSKQLLAFSEGRSSDRHAIAVDDVVSEVERLLRHVLGEHIELRWRPGSGHAAFMYAGELEQVLVNLVLNARDAMPDGGSVTISTSDGMLHEPLADGITNAPAGEYVVVSVADTGKGMDAATRARVFDQGFTTKVPAQGAGLGLPSVLAAVRRTGGDLVLTTSPRGGARFDLYLPRVAAPELARQAAAPVPLGSEHVLVVVEDGQVRSATVRMLEGLGYEATGVGTVEEAAACGGEDFAPDLLIVDLALPVAVCQDLARSAAARLLYVGDSSPKSVAWPLLVKPFDQRALGLRVRGTLDEA